MTASEALAADRALVAAAATRFGPLTLEEALAANPDHPEVAYLEMAARVESSFRRRIIQILTERRAAGPGPDADSWEAGKGKPEDLAARGAVPKWRLLRPLSPVAIYADSSLDCVRWLWDGLIPEESVVLLAAFMKEGKSTFAYAMLGAILAGRDFLGRATHAVPALVLAVEEHLRDVKGHLREAGIGPDALLTIHSGPYPPSAEGYVELRAYVRQHSVRLVVVDTLSRFWDIRNENDNAEVILKVGPLLNLAREEHLTVLLLHHTTDKKGAGASVFRHGREIRGASALFALVDQALLLARVKGQAETLRVLRSVGRYRETPRELFMDFDREAGTYRVPALRQNSDEELREVRARKIVGFVAENPGIRRKEVPTGAHINRRDALAEVRRLLSEGRLIERDGGLSLPEKEVPGGLGNRWEPSETVPGSPRPLGGERGNRSRTVGGVDGTPDDGDAS